jgi:hypothetical protein
MNMPGYCIQSKCSGITMPSIVILNPVQTAGADIGNDIGIKGVMQEELAIGGVVKHWYITKSSAVSSLLALPEVTFINRPPLWPCCITSEIVYFGSSWRQGLTERREIMAGPIQLH